MLTTLRRVILFVGSVFILLGAWFIVIRHSQQTEWQTYQQLYFERTGQPADIHLREIVPQMTGQPELCLTAAA